MRKRGGVVVVVVVIVIWGEEHLWMGLEDGFKEKALLLLHQ